MSSFSNTATILPVTNNMTSTNVIESILPIDMINRDNIGLEAIWSGNPTGTFSFLISNRYHPQTNPSVAFTTLTLASPPANPSGSSGSWFLDINQLPARWFKVRYTNASGTGTLEVHIFVKGIGS